MNEIMKVHPSTENELRTDSAGPAPGRTEETLLSKLTTFEHSIVVDELAHIESALSYLRQVIK